MAIAVRTYRLSLRLYPAPFRLRFGMELEQTFRDACRAARRNRGWLGLVAFLGPAFVDVVWTAYQEGKAAVRKALTLVGLVLAALALGLGIALVDASPGWDDTGISAAALFAACFLLGAVKPRHPWLWAVAVGLWIPLLTIVPHPESPNYATLLALVFALTGAYAGAATRKMLARADSDA